MSSNLRDNEVNYSIVNALKFHGNSSLDTPIRYPRPAVTIIIRGGNKYRKKSTARTICLWDSVAYRRTIKRNILFFTRQNLGLAKYNIVQSQANNAPHIM